MHKLHKTKLKFPHETICGNLTKSKSRAYILGPRIAFTWGLDTNNILGHEKSQATHAPEQVDCFRRLGVGISMVSIGTYHTVFLGQSGEVYTCGHGVGGRLGHGDERSLLVGERARSFCYWSIWKPEV